MKQYKANIDSSVYSINGIFIPAIEGNRHYHQMLGEIDAGEAEILPYEPVTEIPSVVSMRKARLALLQAGLLPSVESAMAAMPESTQEEIAIKEAAKIEWEYSQTVERDNSVFLALTSVMGLTDTEIDSLFVLADSL